MKTRLLSLLAVCALGCDSSAGSRMGGTLPASQPPVGGNVSMSPLVGSGGTTSSNSSQSVPSTSTTVTPPASGTAGSTPAPSTMPPPSVMMSAGGTSGGAAGMASTMTTNVTPDPPGTVTLTTDTFMLQPNQEIYKCQNFDNPFGNKETAINRLVTDMSPGSHHLHVYHQTEGTSRTLEDCTISDFHPLMFGAAMPHTEMQYEPGMAVKLLANNGVRIQVHYLNTKNESFMVSATLKLSPVDESTVTKWVSELYFNRAALQVPVGTSSITTTCPIPSTYGTIGLVASAAHMHSRGTNFVATTSTGVQLIQTTDWESSGVLNNPIVMLKPGDSISWTCTYDNETGGPLTFGESALTNEMCIFLGRFYSAPDQAQIECQAQGDTGQSFVQSY